MLIVVNLTLGCGCSFVAITGCSSIGTRVLFSSPIVSFVETGCASSGYKFDSCGILKETGEKF